MAKLIKPKKQLTFNPLTGDFDTITDNNFSYESVPENKKLSVRANNQMIVMDRNFEIEENAELDLEGSLILEE